MRRLRPQTLAARRHAIAKDLKTLDHELANLTRAIKAGGGRGLDSLVAEVHAIEARKRALAADHAKLTKAEGLASLDLKRVESQLRERLDDWQGLLTRHGGAARQILAKLIPDRLTFTPHVEGAKRWNTFEGVGRLEPLLHGIIPVTLPTMTRGAATSMTTRAATTRREAVRQHWWPQRELTG